MTVTAIRFPANGININVTDQGSGENLLLIHGVGSNLESWDDVVSELRGDYRIVRFDLRGHGRSDKPPGPYAIDQFAADAKAVLDHLQIQQAHVVGFSLGGLIAQAFALNYPGTTLKLGILSAVANKSAQQMQRLKQRADDLERYGSTATIDEALERWFTPEFREANPDLIAKRIATSSENDPKAYAAAYRAFVETDLGAQLHKIHAPTLVMTGEHDPGSSATMARFMHEQITDSKLVIIPRLRHNILVEGPAFVAATLLSFLHE